MKRNHILLLAIVFLGLAVRIMGIDFGLPLLCHNDESVIVNYALAYGKGDFNPHFFKVPPLLSYMLFFLYGVFFVVGKILGYFRGVMDFGYRFLSDPTAFYIIGRLFCGVFFGTLSIPLIYLLGKKLFNERTGLLAAFFLSINFLHVRNSHYIYFDIPLVFFTLLFFILLLRLFERNKINDYLWAGFVLGVAISVKYSAAILVAPAFIISVINIFRFKENTYGVVRNNIMAVLAVIFGMFITNPYMFIDHGFFLDTISRMPFFRPPFWFHLKVSLFGGVGAIMCLLALIGGVISLKKRNIYSAVLVIFFVIYYLILTRSSQLAERYVFPVLPVVLLMAAYCVMVFLEKIKFKSVKYLTGVVLCGVMVFPSSLKIYYVDKLFMGKDTRLAFHDWINKNVPSGTKIALDSTGELTTVLRQNRDKLKESLDNLTNPKFQVPEDALKYKVKLILNNPYTRGEEYNIFYIKTRPGKERFLNSYPEVYLDVDKMKSLSIEYIVLNKLLLLDRQKFNFLDKVEENAILVKEFSPYEDDKYRLVPFENTVLPAAAFSFSELRDRTSFGPVIRVYKMRKNDESKDIRSKEVKNEEIDEK